jgi:hypothetical protein
MPARCVIRSPARKRFASARPGLGYGRGASVRERAVRAIVAVVEHDPPARDSDLVGDEAGGARALGVGEGRDASALVEDDLAEAREVEGVGEGQGEREDDPHALEGLVVGVDRAVRGGEVLVRHAGHGEDDARRRREGLAVGAELDAREGLENGSSGAFADRPGDPHAIPDRETRREAAAAVVDENPLGSCRISVVVEVFFLHEDALQRIAGATQEAADHDAFDRDTGPRERRRGIASPGRRGSRRHRGRSRRRRRARACAG